jgi:hypothetical protein
MKSTIISVVAAVVVLAAAWVVGICIREVRFSSAQTNRVEMPTSNETDIESEPVGPVSTNRLAAEERARRYQERTSQSQQEREKVRSQIRDRFGTNQREGRQKFSGMSQEEMTKLREQWANMSEQERRQYMSQMREIFSGGQKEEKSDSALQETAGSQEAVAGTMENEAPASESSAVPQEDEVMENNNLQDVNQAQ